MGTIGYLDVIKAWIPQGKQLPPFEIPSNLGEFPIEYAGQGPGT